MGESYSVISVEVIQDGLIQVDIEGDESGERIRFFAEPGELIGQIAESMQENFEEHREEYLNELSGEEE